MYLGERTHLLFFLAPACMYLYISVCPKDIMKGSCTLKQLVCKCLCVLGCKLAHLQYGGV